MNLILLTLIFFSIFLSSCSEDDSSNLQTNKEIEKIQETIDHFEKKSMNEEVESLDAFRINYSQFVKDLEESEINDEKVKELEIQKEVLIKRKIHE